MASGRKSAPWTGQLSSHPAARDLLQIKLSQSVKFVWPLWKHALKKAKKRGYRKEEGEKEWETTEGMLRSGNKEEKLLQELEQLLPAAMENLCWSRFLAGLQSVESPCQSRGSNKEKPLCTDLNISLIPSVPSGVGIEESGVKEWSWAWEKGEKRCSFNVCLFVCHYLNLF